MASCPMLQNIFVTISIGSRALETALTLNVGKCLLIGKKKKELFCNMLHDVIYHHQNLTCNFLKEKKKTNAIRVEVSSF
jgi:hypothetical protein